MVIPRIFLSGLFIAALLQRTSGDFKSITRFRAGDLGNIRKTLQPLHWNYELLYSLLANAEELNVSTNHCPIEETRVLNQYQTDASCSPTVAQKDNSSAAESYHLHRRNQVTLNRLPALPVTVDMFKGVALANPQNTKTAATSQEKKAWVDTWVWQPLDSEFWVWQNPEPNNTGRKKSGSADAWVWETPVNDFELTQNISTACNVAQSIAFSEPSSKPDPATGGRRLQRKGTTPYKGRVSPSEQYRSNPITSPSREPNFDSQALNQLEAKRLVKSAAGQNAQEKEFFQYRKDNKKNATEIFRSIAVCAFLVASGLAFSQPKMFSSFDCKQMLHFSAARAHYFSLNRRGMNKIAKLGCSS